MAPLAPTVVHARGSTPRRLVTRPFFHGLAPQQHTRLRALGLATPAVAVDAQQAKQRNAGALVQHRARVPDHAWMACRGGSWFSCRPRSAVLAKVRLNKQLARVRVARASTVGWEELCAFRGVGGDPTGPWTGHRHARITQRRRVGELQLELYFLAVSGQFHELVKRRKNRLRASRACSRGAPGRAQPVGKAQRARRRLAGLARGTGSGRAKCT